MVTWFQVVIDVSLHSVFVYLLSCILLSFLFFFFFFFFLKGKDKFCKKIGENTSPSQIPWPRWAAEPRNTTLTTSYRAITQNINHMTIYKKGWETPSLANEDPSQPTSLCKLKQQPICVQLAASSLYLRLSSKLNNYIRRIVLVKKGEVIICWEF